MSHVEGCPASPAASVSEPCEAALSTPVHGAGADRAPAPPPTTEKQRRSTAGAKRKRDEEAKRDREEVEKKAKLAHATENIEKAILAAAPSAAKVLEILRSEKASA